MSLSVEYELIVLRLPSRFLLFLVSAVPKVLGLPFPCPLRKWLDSGLQVEKANE
jgi:hypothetical protein